MSIIPLTSMIAWIALTAFHIIQDTSSAAETRSEEQGVQHKTVHGNAQVVCEFPAHRETITKLNAYLLKGVDRVVLSEVNWNSTVGVMTNNSEFYFAINVTKEEKYAEFYWRDLQVSHTDSYICKIEVIDPPPYETNSSRTLIYVTELLQPPEMLYSLNMAIAIALGFVAFYSVIITAAVCHCWLKSKKNRVLQNDYFNMMSWQSNGLRKRSPQLGVPVRNYTAYRSWEP
ncbi:T-cell-specific surface glycoprotein CD28 [Candoia aspera]|uniref:T-cell-specific surface glycoprotein CD28 n=1 Tax=Candoia aspera TaxID=51853 RepID=UPI002FD874DE